MIIYIINQDTLISLLKLPLQVKSIRTGICNTAPVFFWYQIDIKICIIAQHYCTCKTKGCASNVLKRLLKT